MGGHCIRKVLHHDFATPKPLSLKICEPMGWSRVSMKHSYSTVQVKLSLEDTSEAKIPGRRWINHAAVQLGYLMTIKLNQETSDQGSSLHPVASSPPSTETEPRLRYTPHPLNPKKSTKKKSRLVAEYWNTTNAFSNPPHQPPPRPTFLQRMHLSTRTLQ